MINKTHFKLTHAVAALFGMFFMAFADNPPSPTDVLEALAKGNQRFVSGKPEYPHQDAARKAEATQGQHPVATVISCSDSRVPPELIFDKGLGDLFIIRVIGNIGSLDETGSAEYGTEHLNTPVLVVLGHTKCGAVTAAVTHAEVHGSIPPVLAHITPAVRTTKHDHPNLKDDELIAEAIKANVFHSIQELFDRSSIIRHRVSSGKLKIVGAIYDISNGQVNWLGEHPKQTQLLAHTHTVAAKHK